MSSEEGKGKDLLYQETLAHAVSRLRCVSEMKVRSLFVRSVVSSLLTPHPFTHLVFSRYGRLHELQE